MAVGVPRRRMRAMTIGVLIVFSLFAGQLLRLQGFNAAATSAEALKGREYNKAIPALRGSIVSADGTVLASSVERRTVTADQTAVCTYKVKRSGGTVPCAASGITAATKALAPLLRTTEAKLRPRLTGNLRYRILAKDVSPMTWRQINKLGIPGIYSEISDDASATRSYPTTMTAASLVGYLTNDGRPGGGVELMLDKELGGTQGHAYYEVAQNGQPIPSARHEITPAVPGDTVRLTIDSDLQWYAQNVLAQKVNEVEALSGTVVVMEAKTGRLLALASYPTFNPDELAKARGSLSNLALTDVFEPGSTSKVMTAAAALEEGKVTPSTGYVVNDRIKRSDKEFKDSHDHPTEYLTTAGVLAQSSNVGTLLMGEKVEPSVLDSYFRRFGMGAKSGVGFPGESPGLFPSWEKWNGSQRYTVMFGQGISVTAVQAAGVYQAIANNGVRIEPRLVESLTDGKGVVRQPAASKTTEVVSQETAKGLRTMLEEVVTKNGTAPQAAVPGYRVAGKTGTAERYDEKLRKYSGYTASFIGMAPADDPELVVAAIVERPIKGHYGGQIAGPVFSDVMSYALKKQGVAPSTTATPKVALKLASPPASTDTSVVRDPRAGELGRAGE